MGKSNTQQASFIAGEVSPLLRGRVDVQKFRDGAETVENFIVRPQGPLWRRNGTQHITRNWRWDQGANLLVPFVFSSVESYLIEFGSTSFIVRNNTTGLPVTVTGATVSGFADNGVGLVRVTTSGAHGFSTADGVLITGASISRYNGLWDITVITATTFDLLFSVFVGAGSGSPTASKVVQVAHPYALADLPALSFAQSADIMFLCNPKYKPRKITRSSATSWAISEFTLVDGPYLDYDKTNTRLTVSNIIDTATLTGNTSFGAVTPFVAGDVGDYIEYFDDNEWYLANISAIISTTVATVDIIDRVLVGIHPAIRLGNKRDGANPAARSPLLSNTHGVSRSQPLQSGRPTDRLYRPIAHTPGIDPNKSPTPVAPEGLDRQAAITVPGSIVSSHSNTFSTSDVGKIIRTNTLVWRIIDGFTDHRTVTFTTTINVASGNMKNYTYPTQVVTLNQNSRTITATLTASAATFVSSDVGRHIRMNFQGRWVYAKVSAFSSSTSVTIQMFESFPRHLREAGRLANDGITDIWRFGAWYGSDGSGNYPSHVTFHEQRLVFAATPAEPQTLWFSRPQDFDKMSPSEPDGSVLDDNAINVTLASNKVNSIKWLQSMRVLIVGTLGGEWQGRAASSITEPITPTNLAFTEETTHGSMDDARPVKVGSAVLFLQRSGQKLKELTYNFELDGWTSRDLTIASEHILRKGTKGIKIAYQNEPHSIVWVLTSSGTLAAMTYNREQEVVSWHYHSLGGSGVVESIAVLPSSTGTEDNVFLSVRRTVNSQTERFIEKFTSDNYPATPSSKTGFFYLDSGVTQTMSGSGSSWNAFGHLIGETVTLVKNGVLVGTTAVASDGSVVISSVNGDVLTGGLPYTSKFKSLPVQGGSPFGSSDMTKKRVARLFLRVYNSINAKIGRDENNLQLRTFDGAVGSELLKTGDIEINANTEYSSDGVFHVQVSDPYPLILLSTVAQLNSFE